nr:glycosyltransferase family 4 protein [Paracoccus sp. NBH48]
MHVAYVTTDPGIPPFGTKGASIHVQSVLRVLLAMGHRVTLFSPCLAVAPAAEFATVALHPLPGAPRGDDAEARAAWALALNETVAAALTQAGPFDLVYERHALFAHGAMEWAGRGGVPSALELNAPLIAEQTRHRHMVRQSDAPSQRPPGFRGRPSGRGGVGGGGGLRPRPGGPARPGGGHPQRRRCGTFRRQPCAGWAVHRGLRRHAEALARHRDPGRGFCPVATRPRSRCAPADRG